MSQLDEVMNELSKPIVGEAYVCIFTLPLDDSKWKRLMDEFGLVLALPTRNPTLPPEMIYGPKLPENYCPYAPPLGSGGDFTKRPNTTPADIHPHLFIKSEVTDNTGGGYPVTAQKGYYCQKAEAQGVQVCNECREINDAYQACLGVGDEERARRASQKEKA